MRTVDHVLDSPAPLSARARAFLAGHAVLEADTGTGRVEFWYAIMDERPDE